MQPPPADTPPDLYHQVGLKIREARNRRRMSQEALADLVSLKRTSITNIEKGRQKLLLHKLWDIAVALAVDPASLLPTPKPPAINDSIPNKLLEGLSDKDKQLIVEAAVATPKKGA